MSFDVFIPQPGSYIASVIDPGSGVYAGIDGDGSYTVDFEGNRYGAVNLRRWADRVYHAHGRQITRYPTVARLSHIPAGDLIRVGHFDETYGEIELNELTPEVARVLEQWCGELPHGNELLATGHAFEALRIVRKWTVEERRQLRRLPPRERRMYEAAGLI